MKQIIKNIPKGFYNLAVTCAVTKMVIDAVSKCTNNIYLYEKEIKEKEYQQKIVQMLALTLLFFVFFCFVYLGTHP